MAHQLPSGHWRAQVSIGNKKYSKVFPTKAEAEVWASLKKGSRYGGVARPKKGDIAKQTLSDEFLDYICIPIGKAINRIDKMSGAEFEDYCKALLRNTGLFPGTVITRTPDNQDFGADLVIDTDDNKRIIIQCKRYASNISIDAVQEVYSAKDYYNADMAVIMTNARFTPAAIKLAQKTDVVMIDRESLLAMIAIANRYTKKILSYSQWDLLEEAIDHELSTNTEIPSVLKYS